LGYEGEEGIGCFGKFGVCPLADFAEGFHSRADLEQRVGRKAKRKVDCEADKIRKRNSLEIW